MNTKTDIHNLLQRAAMTLAILMLTILAPVSEAWAENVVTLTEKSKLVTLYDGDVLTGTGGSSTRVEIKKGTVTLRDVNIICEYPSPAITCPYFCTIILEGKNYVESTKQGYAGIKVRGNLTITGPGSLTVKGGEFAAGIGSNYASSGAQHFENINITGGTIRAYGGRRGAAIGTGCNTDNHSQFFSNITITGGDLFCSSVSCAAIGLGYDWDRTGSRKQRCSSITIGSGIDRIRLYAADAESVRIIGGLYCNHLTIGSGLYQVSSTQEGYGIYRRRLNIYGPSEVTFAKEGYSTFYNTQADATLPEGMKAMIVTAKGDGQTLTYETIADGSLTEAATAVVPANTPVMLQVAPSTETHTVGGISLTSPEAAAISQTNQLAGSDTLVTTTGDGLHYKLSYNTSGTALGWYWGVDGGGAFTSKAHKAWLALPSTAGTRGFFGLPGDDDHTTGIETPPLTPPLAGAGSGCAQEEGEWFSLDGRRLSDRPSAKGLYIHNGRKEVVK